MTDRRRRRRVTLALALALAVVMLVATAACVFPVMLRATGGAALSITAMNGGETESGLRTALGWWRIGFPIALLYFAMLFRMNRGKSVAAPEGEGY